MIQYGSVDVKEMQLIRLRASIDLRDEQWIDVEIRFGVGNADTIPDDVTDLTALLICTYSGGVAQIVPQDGGIDCEYQFTPGEKEQLLAFYELQVKPQLLEKAGSGARS
ncbi:hypothetical protein N0M98_13095 [Paenibacillus doosanensis]|uniref:hypothetical protein n=1 Tax=Paenibacillus doosanensis TaxID=1229154 RepID=UPI00218029BD|nr:hypothetical protein [Paenibacillus doosanensis]MCS7461083.1 hypothetical protein [Paenibacillus doosanensis]